MGRDERNYGNYLKVKPAGRAQTDVIAPISPGCAPTLLVAVATQLLVFLDRRPTGDARPIWFLVLSSSGSAHVSPRVQTIVGNSIGQSQSLAFASAMVD
jgi:hypothetical protein